MNSQRLPLLDWDRLPAFDRFEADQIQPAVTQLLAEAEAKFSDLEADPPTTWEGLMAPLEGISDALNRLIGAVQLWMACCDSDALRAAWDTVEGPIMAFSTRMDQSRPLYDAMVNLRDRLGDSLTGERKRLLDGQIREMRLGGVGLEGEASTRYQAIVQELAALSTRFSHTVLDAQKSWAILLTEPAQVDGLPDSWRQLAAALAAHHGAEGATPESGPWRVSIDYPVSLPILTHGRDRALREDIRRRLMRIAGAAPHDNTPVIEQILRLRREMAQLLGFQTYAELSIARKMAPSVNDVQQRIEGMAAAARDAAVAELAELDALAAEAGAPEAGDLQAWDVSFWAERLRERNIGLSDDELRPYFSFENVLASLFSLTERVFGVVLEQTSGVATWHPDVRTYRATDRDGTHLADFYLDAFARPGEKRAGAWMSPLVGRSVLLAPDDAPVRLPVAAIVCNQAPPTDERPSLMSFREVETLFHEMGHALHQMLTLVDDARLAGTNGVEWDAVEVPSMFLQSWIHHAPTLRAMAVHYKTGEPLPDAYVDRLNAARTHQAATSMLGQADLALGDLDLHHAYDPDSGEDLHARIRALSTQLRVMPPLADDRRMCSFSHLFAGGYAAGYYSYRWAELLALDAFSAFTEADENTEQEAILGARWRDTVLSSGGGRHPMDLFRDFRGRDPDDGPLLRWYGLAS